MTTEQLVKDAISRSKSHNEIVHIKETSLTVVYTLRGEADGWCQANGVHEFWGKDSDGNEWRVHVDSVTDMTPPPKAAYAYHWKG